MRKLLENSLDAIVVTNGDRRLVYANPKALDLFGVSVLNMGKFTIDTFLSHCQILELRRKWFAIRRDERYGICKIRPLDGSLRVAQYILVANVIPRRYLYTFRNEELSKQLGISYEHARRLQAGETLPSQLLVEKTAATVGVSVEQLQLAVQRDARKHVLPKKRAKEKAGTKPTPEAKPPVRVRITTIPTYVPKEKNVK